MHLLNTLPQRLDPGATPTFAGLIATSLTSPASTNLTLGLGTGGTALTLASSTLAATFAGAVTAAPAGYSVNASGTYGMSLCQIDNSLDRLGLTAGVSVSGGTFTARYAAPMVVRMAPDVGVFQICVDSGKTIGNAYTPTGQLEISSTGATFAGAVSVGTGAAVGGATAGAGGLAFPATAVAVADANTLDDYEEGTWTPTDNSGAALSFTVYSSTYTKIGRLVEVEAAIYFPATASTAAVQITGLPFTAAGGDDNTGGLSITATNVGGNYYMLITRGSSTFTINTNADVGVTNVTYSSKVLKFFGWYHV